MQCHFIHHLWKIKRVQVDLLKTLKWPSLAVQAYRGEAAEESRQEETQRQRGVETQQAPCEERGRGWKWEMYSSSCTWDGRDLQAKKCQGLLPAWRPSEARTAGPIQGRCRFPLSSLCFLSRGFCALLTPPNIIKISTSCLPTHQVQETDINSRRSFSKESSSPSKPALDLLSSIPNRLQAQLDLGAIQYTGFLFII